MVEWIEWDGNGMPYVMGWRADLKFRYGSTTGKENILDWGYGFDWHNRTKDGTDIVAYRPHEPKYTS